MTPGDKQELITELRALAQAALREHFDYATYEFFTFAADAVKDGMSVPNATLDLIGRLTAERDEARNYANEARAKLARLREHNNQVFSLLVDLTELEADLNG